MNLTDTQKQTVADWINAGLKLGEIQKRLGSEFGIQLTYMEARFLVDDLKLVPKDPEKPKPSALTATAAPPAPAAFPTLPAAGAPLAGCVSVTVDQIARPGAVASGSVKFSDGEMATWYMDQLGRLGLGPQKQGYKPSSADLKSFQAALEVELSKLGY